MEKPYTFDFAEGNGILHESIDALPDWCSYPLAFAQDIEHFDSGDGFMLVRQAFGQAPFFIDLVEMRLKQPMSVPFIVDQRQLFLYFMLEGSASFTTAENRPIIVTRPGTFQMSIYEVGGYLVHVGKGIHIALIVSILPEWIESMYGDFPNLQQILRRFKEGNRPSEAMCQVRMDRKIRRWLHKIYSYSQQNIGAVDGNLRLYISYVLEYYDGLLETQDDNLAYRAKVYMDEHYLNPALSMKFLADQFHVTERTLLNQFRKQYNTSVHGYYSVLRAKHALRLMEEHGLTTNDIYLQVGYSDESSLRYAMRRYLGDDK